MNTSSSILSNLLHRISQVRTKQAKVDLLTNTLLLGTCVLALAILMILAEILFDFSRIERTVIAILVTISFLGAVSWLIVLPLLRLMGIFISEENTKVARRIGAFFPKIRDRLLNAIQLAENIDLSATLYSVPLIDASLTEFAREIQSLNFTQAIGTSHVYRYVRYLLISFCFTFLLFFTFPGSTISATYRLLHYGQEFTPPPKFLFDVSPGDKEIVKGENVDVQVRITELVPSLTRRSKELIVAYHQEGQETIEEIKVQPDSAGIYRTIFQIVRTSTEYFARFADAESDHFKLTVLDRPIIRSFHIRLDFPAYSKIPPRIQDEFVGDVTALAGTHVSINGSASKVLHRAEMQFSDSTRSLLTVRGEKFNTSFNLIAQKEYSINITDAEGLKNTDPVHYQLKVMPDEYPVISIVEPGRNVDIASNQSINLLIKVKDDFGFTSSRLGYRLVKSQYEKAQADYSFLPILLNVASGIETEIPFLWDLSKLDLVPEDVIEYFADVFDNDAVNGPKSGRSNLYLLRLPSLEEVFADADKEHERSIEDLKQSLEQAKKLKDDIESINRDLKRNKDPDWQTQRKLDEMAKQYQDVQKKLNNVESRLEQMTQQMQQQNILSKETMEKYFELQQLFQQLDVAELQKVLKQMQQSMPNISKEQLQQAMQNMTFSEERFRQSIERTLNLLKRIQIEQKMDEVKKRAQELNAMEKELQEQSAKAANDLQKQQELAKQQADLAKKEQAMEREAADLQRRMEECFTEMPADRLQKLNEQLQQQQLSQKMQKASQQMQTGNMQSAQQTQQQIQQQLQEFSNQMDAMQQQMLQQQAQYVMNELRKASANLLELSKSEEALKQQAQSAPANSPQLRENAQNQQQAIQDLQNIVKGLAELSQKSFAVTPEMGKAIGEALARMNNAMRGLDMRNGSTASLEQGQAMAALNRAAIQIQNALQAMMQGGGSGAGSLMQQLQMMASQQMSINMQTQQMGGMTSQQAAEAARLAKEQEAVRKSLEQLNHEAQQSGEQQKLLGDLNKIAEEMKEVVRNLEQNDINPETIRKQERILSRLLDASKSMRERDYEKKRKAETGTQFVRRSPKDINFETLEDNSRLHEELLKALEQGYSKDYQELIRKYFEELEKTEKSVH